MNKATAEPPRDRLAWRKATGLDRYDERWAGVLHMAPALSRSHQALEGSLESYLLTEWSPRGHGEVFHQINVARPGRWPEDFRIPDLVLLLADRRSIDRDEYFDGGPNVVIEIESPGDETRAKLGFYAEIDVREVWIVERDTRRVEVLRLGATAYEAVGEADDGWIPSAETGLELRCREELLEIRRSGEPSSAVRLGPRGRA